MCEYTNHVIICRSHNITAFHIEEGTAPDDREAQRCTCGPLACIGILSLRAGYYCARADEHELRIVALSQEIATLRQQLEELTAIKAGRERIRASFGHRDGADRCQCPYCTGDADALAELASEYEMAAHTARQQLAETQAALNDKCATDALKSHLLAERDAQIVTLRKVLVAFEEALDGHIAVLRPHTGGAS